MYKKFVPQDFKNVPLLTLGLTRGGRGVDATSSIRFFKVFKRRFALRG